MAFAKQCGDGTHPLAHFDARQDRVLSTVSAGGFAKQCGESTHLLARLFARQNRELFAVSAGGFYRATLWYHTTMSTLARAGNARCAIEQETIHCQIEQP